MLFYVTIKYNDLLKNKFIQRQIESSRYFKFYPVGVIFAVSADRKNIKFINLQDLTFTSKTDTHNFNPKIRMKTLNLKQPGERLIRALPTLPQPKL